LKKQDFPSPRNLSRCFRGVPNEKTVPPPPMNFFSGCVTKEAACLPPLLLKFAPSVSIQPNHYVHVPSSRIRASIPSFWVWPFLEIFPPTQGRPFFTVVVLGRGKQFFENPPPPFFVLFLCLCTWLVVVIFKIRMVRALSFLGEFPSSFFFPTSPPNWGRPNSIII